MSLKQYKEEEDEIKLHKYGRILTANECHYRIAGFKQHHTYPSVKRLQFFVPEKKRIVCEEGSVISEEYSKWSKTKILSKVEVFCLHRVCEKTIGRHRILQVDETKS